MDQKCKITLAKDPTIFVYIATAVVVLIVLAGGRDHAYLCISPQIHPQNVNVFSCCIYKCSRRRMESRRRNQKLVINIVGFFSRYTYALLISSVKNPIRRPHKVSQGLTRSHKVSQGLTRSHKGSHVVHISDQGFSGSLSPKRKRKLSIDTGAQHGFQLRARVIHIRISSSRAGHRTAAILPTQKAS